MNINFGMTFSCLKLVVQESDDTPLLYLNDHVERVDTEVGNISKKIKRRELCVVFYNDFLWMVDFQFLKNVSLR